jgi:invasion protein IalB
MTNWKTALGAALLTLSTTGAVAQAPASPPLPVTQAPASPPPPLPVTKAIAPAPIAGTPIQTTATYGDWVLRCAHAGEGATGPQTCEIVQTLVLQGQQQPIAQVAIGSIDKTAALRLTVVVPTAISFSKTAYIVGTAGTPNLFDLTWRRCLPSGCFADIALTPDALKTMRTRTEPANLVFRDAGERDITLPFSMRGFSQSLDALSKETVAVR